VAKDEYYDIEIFTTANAAVLEHADRCWFSFLQSVRLQGCGTRRFKRRGWSDVRREGWIFIEVGE